MPRRGWRSSASRSVASSSIERPIVPPGPGRVLHQEPGVAVAAARGSARAPRTTRSSAAVEAGAEVRADVEDDRVRLDRARGVDRGAHRRDRLLVDRVVGRGEVAEVERVADDPADARLGAPRLEPLDRLRLVRGRPPHARALREHLHAVAADRLDPVDRGVDAARRGHVRAELHAEACRTAATYDERDVRRPRPHGSEPDRLPARRRRPHVPLQLALRPPAGRRVPAADREHRHEPRGRGGGRADPGVAPLARDRLGRPRHLPARPDGRGAHATPSGCSPRARPTRTRARSASACPTRASSAGTTPCAAGSSSRTRTSPTS